MDTYLIKHRDSSIFNTLPEYFKYVYEGVSKSFRTVGPEQRLQIV
jgi:hypothetical protein